MSRKTFDLTLAVCTGLGIVAAWVYTPAVLIFITLQIVTFLIYACERIRRAKEDQ